MLNAINAIGRSNLDDDWFLKPDQHADTLPQEAEALADILRGSKAESIIKKYNTADVQACNAQKNYKKFSKYGVLSSSCAALIGATLLFLKSADTASSLYMFINKYQTWLLFAEGLSIALTIYFAYFLKHNKYFDKWMSARAKAETARVSLFEFVCTVEVDQENGNDIYLNHLKLEYFRRYQLEVQLSYYSGRGNQHKVAANKIVTCGGVIVFLTVLSGAFIGIFNDVDIISALAFVGVSVPVLQSAHSNISLISQDERNAMRYANTYDHLVDLSGELDEIRSEVQLGNNKALNDYVNLVNDEVSVEHREWIRLQKKSDMPILIVNN